MDEQFMNNVYGLNQIKEELNIINSWYQDTSLTSNKKILLPKGILFIGQPGSGKTLLLREFSSSFLCSIYVIKGIEDNIVKEIIGTYKKAKIGRASCRERV